MTNSEGTRQPDTASNTLAEDHIHGQQAAKPTTVSRRGALAFLGAGAAGAAVGAAGAGIGISVAHGGGLGTGTLSTTSADGSLHYPFYGEHQAGIDTPVQDRLHFAAFDMADGATREDLVSLLKDWTYAASRITQGLDVSARGAFEGGEYMPPDDTGEAVGLPPAGLTVTFGFGRSLFVDGDGRDRFGLAGALPRELKDVPAMVNDVIDPDKSHGDLCVQACANDPQVAVHAIRNLARIAVGRAELRWSQLGFGRSSSTSTAQATPRNLFGFKDGTSNITTEDTEGLAKHVWIAGSGKSAWAAGGSYLIARRIAMNIEVWDDVQLGEQERVTGRDKREGAPLSGEKEFDTPDFTKKGKDGQLLIDPRSHVARVHPTNNGGIRMLRRGFNFVDGNDQSGQLNAGLFFIAFVNDPANFVAVHRNMSRDDLFVEYLKTKSTGVYIVPPGVADGGYIGEQLISATK